MRNRGFAKLAPSAIVALGKFVGFKHRFMLQTIEVMAVVLCVVLAQNERNRTWASIERNFVAKITQMITPEQIKKP